MRANLLVSPGRLAMQDIDIPQPGPGQVLVRVKAALTCGTDLKAFLRGHPQIPMPGPFGHEFSGVVAAVGEGVSKFKVDDEVMSVHSAPCGDCYWCEHGQGNLCESIMESKVLGAYAEYVLVPAHIVEQNMFIKPDNLSFPEAAILEPLACVVYGLQRVPVRHTDTVLVIGAGAIGLLFLQTLLARDVSTVIMAGRREYRLKLAREIGASRVIDVTSQDIKEVVEQETSGRGADLVIECTGKPEVWEQATGFARRGGHVLLFGGCPKGTSVTFDTARLHYDQITLHSPFHFDPGAVEEAFVMLRDEKVKPGGLIS
ncbi:MAG TPA: alcohol dehydrogenase catalytic domain-containing protein, partial [Verrucomicrobiae bacterium]|nr:alcohol dehydrogenase catalytic domain-containing protein [Verrucomicrobiae bacterium]